MTNWLDRIFELERRGTTLGREARGALATFLTMAYIVSVNPAVLAAAGVPRAPAVACTAAAAGICCILMGLVANFPVALASGMGLNTLVALSIAPVVGSWQAAMGLVVADGLVVAALVLLGLREAMLQAIPADLRRAIAAGIGLFVALIGAVNAGLVRHGPAGGPPLQAGSLAHPQSWLTAAGLLVTMVLLVRRVNGAVVLGILATTAGGFACDRWLQTELIAAPPATWDAPQFDLVGAAEFGGLWRWSVLPLLLSLLMVDFFDTLGTVSALADQAGLRRDGRVPRLRAVLLVDSFSAAIGGWFGVSSVTSYVESAAGIAEGARTGLHTVLVGVLFLGCILLAPIASLIPDFATAPALITVGFLMTAQIVQIDLARVETALPAFLIVVMIPFTYSIAHGIGFGFVTYVGIQLLSLRFREVHPLMYGTALLFALYLCWSGES